MVWTGMLALGAGGVSAQTYPTKPLRIVIAGVGAGTDFLARIIGQGISVPLGQNVVVESRSTAIIAAEVVARAAPDGHTSLLIAGNLWTTPLIERTPYDPVKDFSPVSMVTSAPNMLVVHPSVSAKSVSELINLAKAKPGQLNYSIGALGGATHLAGELFKAMAGVNIVMVPYKSSAPAITAVLSGEVQIMFPNAPIMAPIIKSGKLRALGVTSLKPSALFPDLPTVAESGLPGYESGTTNALFVPARTPAAVIRRLNQEVVRFINLPDTKTQLLNNGIEPVGNSPEQLAAIIKSEMIRMGKLYKDIGMSLK